MIYWKKVKSVIIKAIKDYFEKCPLLDGKKINVNYLGEEPVSYSIEEVPGNLTIKKYADGGQMRQKLFHIQSRQTYDKEIVSNEKVSQFFEELTDWVEKNNAKKIYPELENGMTSQGVNVVTTSYLLSNNGSRARFAIQFQLVYHKPYV